MLEAVFDSLMFVPVLATVCIGIFTTFLLYQYSIRNHDYFVKKGIPFVKPLPFVGSVLTNIFKPLHETEEERYNNFGQIYGHFEGNRPLLSIADPSLLREILVKDFQYFTSRRDFTTGDKLVDSMLSIIRGEDWKRVRTIVTPTFTTGKIRRMTSIFKDCAKTLVENFKSGKDVELKRVYGAFTMDVIASSAFSTKIDSHNDPDNPFVLTARKVFSRNISWRFLLFLIAPKLTKFFRIGVFDPAAMLFFKTATLQIIEERRKTGQKRNDFLQLLLDTAEEVAKEQKWEFSENNKEADIVNNYGEEPNIEHDFFKNLKSKKSLSMDELIAQCVIFFIAGYDTTASTLSFCCYQLALNQDIQDKAREEVDSVIQEFKGEVTYEGIQKMKYLDNVISETLRIFPPAIRLERLAEADYELGSTGITIPKGMIVTIPTYAMHRDPSLFPNPEKFEPDRFLQEEKEKRDQYSYLPFGAGPRNCVGMRFALMEVKVCLAYVIATFKIQKNSKTKVPLDYYIGQGLLQPKEIHVRMEARDDSPLA